jgi:hypothetical protein
MIMQARCTLHMVVLKQNLGGSLSSPILFALTIHTWAQPYKPTPCIHLPIYQIRFAFVYPLFALLIFEGS